MNRIGLPTQDGERWISLQEVNAQGCIALLQFVRIALRALKQKETDFDPGTSRAHVQKHRLEMKLTQKHVAERHRGTPQTALNWKKGYTEPPIGFYPLGRGSDIVARQIARCFQLI